MRQRKRAYIIYGGIGIGKNNIFTLDPVKEENQVLLVLTHDNQYRNTDPCK
jgi:hypothetical protein